MSGSGLLSSQLPQDIYCRIVEKHLRDAAAHACHFLSSCKSLSQRAHNVKLDLRSLGYIDVSRAFLFSKSRCRFQGLEVRVRPAPFHKEGFYSHEIQATWLEFVEALDLSFCRMPKNVGILGRSACLKVLDLSYCKEIKTLTGLGSTQNLTRIILCGCTELVDIAPLSMCQVLREVDANSCKSLETVSPLKSCTTLEILDLHNSDRLSDVEVLAECKG